MPQSTGYSEPTSFDKLKVWASCGRGCCPSGPMSWITPIFSFLATILFMIAAFHCSLTVSKGDGYEVYIGYWSRENKEMATSLGPDDDNNYCVKWNDADGQEMFDGAWKGGRAMGVIGTFTCFFVLLWDFSLIIMEFHISWFFHLLAIKLWNVLVSFLLLLGLSSNICTYEACQIGPGGYLAILAALAWILSALCTVTMWRTEKQVPPKEEFDPEEDTFDEEQPPKVVNLPMIANAPHNKKNNANAPRNKKK